MVQNQDFKSFLTQNFTTIRSDLEDMLEFMISQPNHRIYLPEELFMFGDIGHIYVDFIPFLGNIAGSTAYIHEKSKIFASRYLHLDAMKKHQPELADKSEEEIRERSSLIDMRDDVISFIQMRAYAMSEHLVPLEQLQQGDLSSLLSFIQHPKSDSWLSHNLREGLFSEFEDNRLENMRRRYRRSKGYFAFQATKFLETNDNLFAGIAYHRQHVEGLGDVKETSEHSDNPGYRVHMDELIDKQRDLAEELEKDLLPEDLITYYEALSTFPDRVLSILSILERIVPHLMAPIRIFDGSVEGFQHLSPDELSNIQSDIELQRFSSLHVPGYKVLRSLGKGGSAGTYLIESKAEGSEVGARYALKILETGQGFGDLMRNEYERLVKLADIPLEDYNPYVIRLIHPIVLTQAGREKQGLVLEYIDGVSLDKVENRSGEIVEQLISGLAFIHQNGITHCDFSPKNILLDLKGNVKIIDFGLAGIGGLEKTSHFNRLYAAPEAQVEGAKINSQVSDVWSLAVLAIEILYGGYPFVPSLLDLSCEYGSEEHKQAIRDMLLKAFDGEPTFVDQVKEILADHARKNEIHPSWLMHTLDPNPERRAEHFPSAIEIAASIKQKYDQNVEMIYRIPAIYQDLISRSGNRDENEKELLHMDQLCERVKRLVEGTPLYTRKEREKALEVVNYTIAQIGADISNIRGDPAMLAKDRKIKELEADLVKEREILARYKDRYGKLER